MGCTTKLILDECQESAVMLKRPHPQYWANVVKTIRWFERKKKKTELEIAFV